MSGWGPSFVLVLISFVQRGAWHPYFMDVKAIIFLAPISVFDEKLEGDSGTNRLEDSMMFWTSICKSKLLVKVTFCLAFPLLPSLFFSFRTVIFVLRGLTSRTCRVI
jgi:G-protein alpha subunit